MTPQSESKYLLDRVMEGAAVITCPRCRRAWYVYVGTLCPCCLSAGGPPATAKERAEADRQRQRTQAPASVDVGIQF